MCARFITCLLVLSCSVLTTACTDTVYREVPQYTTSTAYPNQQSYYPNYNGSTQSVASNMTSAANSTSQLPVTNTQMTGQSQTVSNSTPLYSDGLPVTTLSDAPAGTVTGLPGQVVDCNDTVPCRWTSADSQFALTLTSADNIASRERLSVNFTVLSMHDTQLLVGTVDDVIDSTQTSNKASHIVFNESNGSSPVSAQAGSVIHGTIDFNESASTDSLVSFSISILDNGLIRKANFMNIPVGPLTTDYAQCNYTLPCVWASPDSQVTITLLSVGGFAGNGRLNANFQVLGSRDMIVAVDAGAAAISDTGIRMKGRTHMLAGQTGYEMLTTEAIAGIGVMGTVDFYRTDSIPASLLTLSMVIFEDRPVPRWNPRFDAVPVQ